MRNETTKVLRALSPHAILVGSAGRGEDYADLDFVISDKGLKVALRVFPKGWESVVPGHLVSYDTDPPIEVFTVWWGPSYESLCRRKAVRRVVYDGVELRAISLDTYGE